MQMNMKKFFNILSLVAAASLAVISCVEEKLPHEMGGPEVDGCYGVYFPTQEASGSHVFNPTQDPVIDITVARTNTKGAITVPVVATFSEDGIFKPSEVKFADGQKETTLSVRFDSAKEGVNYAAHFVVTDPQYASLYNANPIGLDFDILRVEMKDFLNPVTGERAVITLNEGWWGEVHQARMQYYEVDGIRTCEFISIEDGGIWGDSVNASLKFTWYTKNNNEAGYNFLEVPKQYFGFDYDGWGSKPESEATYPIYVYDYPWYWVERGYAWGSEGMGADWMEEAVNNGQIDGKYPVGYYDGNGGWYFNLRYYIPGLGGFSPNPYEFVAIADGFTRVDYSLALETDYTFDGVTPIYIEAGADVESVKYAVYEGELTATQVGNKAAAIADGTDASDVVSEFEADDETGKKYAGLYVAPETTGTYTFVAVAYDAAGKVQNSGSINFRHVAEGDLEDHEVDFYVFAEDTPARYENCHDYDSFAYCIAGHDLTEVHVAILKFDDVLKDVDGAFNSVKTTASYAVSDAVLAQINAEGGFYTAAMNQPAATDLVIIVWATNGDMDGWDYDMYTTANLPYVFSKNLGKGTLTDGFLLPLFGMDDVTVACDVYEEENNAGIYMVTGFQLELCAKFYECDPSEIADYEGEDGNWYNAEIVVDASDPAAVHIGEQAYGIYVNEDYGYVYIDSEATGTLENGVITFPARNMYVGLSAAGWYYGNKNGTFAITLPAAASAPALSAPATGKYTKTNFVLTDPQAWNRPAVKFERDPKPVKVEATVSNARKASVNNDSKPQVKRLSSNR